MTEYTRKEIEKKANYMLDNELGSYAFLLYSDRVEIWKCEDDGFYRFHAKSDNENFMKEVMMRQRGKSRFR